jgi:hypothetical protein
MLFPSIGYGQTDTEAERAFLKRQFTGWGGIVFRCLPDNLNDTLQKKICEATAAEARFLAATAKVPFKDLAGADFLEVSIAVADLDGALILEAAVRGTQGSPRAVYVRLRAYSYYANAVETNVEMDSPENDPRSGDLVLWERDVIGSGGTEHELELGVVNAFSTLLKEFFGVFLESRN